MKQAHNSQNVTDISGAKIRVIYSKWYLEAITRVIEASSNVLADANADIVGTHQLPGVYELPMAAQTLVQEHDNQLDGILCFAAVRKGATRHFEMVLDGANSGMMQVMLASGTPIFNGIIPFQEEHELKERTSNDEYNKGIEVALAAAEYIAWKRALA